MNKVSKFRTKNTPVIAIDPITIIGSTNTKVLLLLAANLYKAYPNKLAKAYPANTTNGRIPPDVTAEPEPVKFSSIELTCPPVIIAAIACPISWAYTSIVFKINSTGGIKKLKITKADKIPNVDSELLFLTIFDYLIKRKRDQHY